MAIYELLMPELEMEAATTRKFFERLPEDKLSYKPHEKSMPLDRLAGRGFAEDEGPAAQRLRDRVAPQQLAAGVEHQHGLVGPGRGDMGRRNRLLRTLAHTLGVNAIFVALAVAALTATQQGGSDELAREAGSEDIGRGQSSGDDSAGRSYGALDDQGSDEQDNQDDVDDGGFGLDDGGDSQDV